MKEFDFDELDRAVNSLMTNVPKDPATGGEEVKTVNLANAPAPAFTSAPATPPMSPAPPAKPQVAVPSTAASRPSVATRRSGRFMDVVPPSAGPKPESKKTVSRQGVTITAPTASPPVQPSPQSVESAPAPAASSIVASKPEIATPVPSLHQPQAKSDWPDPLEMANFKDTPKEKISEPATIKRDEPAMQASETASKAEGNTPLTSPFLPNAKIEKRPLGGGTSTQTEDTAPTDPARDEKSSLTVNNPEDQLPATPPPVTQAPLPEELQQDLVAIESGAPKEEQPVAAESKETPSEVAVQPESEKKPDTNPEEASKTGPVSIPQQYREEPSTGDKNNGAIYDTATYHQPLAHPAKKKSGWLWVLWIVLILIVGAGTGAALYFLGII